MGRKNLPAVAEVYGPVDVSLPGMRSLFQTPRAERWFLSCLSSAHQENRGICTQKGDACPGIRGGCSLMALCEKFRV